ncbi:MAG: class I SAM-dependent methyltransferase [Candidatus Riflebacteria bacterium]|nr:class I SAM-dependent methyltransferase [Candidatus Riflebacteria bacterium]
MPAIPPSDCDPLYRDGRHYDGLNDRFQDDLPFYRDLAVAAGGPVLELACGTGRLTIPLAQAGIDITGLDRSAGMLAHARAKAREAAVKVAWVRADARRFRLGRRFRLIFIPFNSLHHLHDRPSLEAFFACVRRHLAPGGRFLVDVFNPSLQVLTRPEGQVYPVGGYPDPDGQGSVEITETNVYDRATQVNRIKWRFAFSDGRPDVVDELNMRVFFPQELDALLVYNGFRLLEKWGGFDRQPFTSASAKQLVLCAAAPRRRTTGR